MSNWVLFFLAIRFTHATIPCSVYTIRLFFRKDEKLVTIVIRVWILLWHHILHNGNLSNHTQQVEKLPSLRSNTRTRLTTRLASRYHLWWVVIHGVTFSTYHSPHHLVHKISTNYTNWSQILWLVCIFSQKHFTLAICMGTYSTFDKHLWKTFASITGQGMTIIDARGKDAVINYKILSGGLDFSLCAIIFKV